jgi:hypothetical protein
MNAAWFCLSFDLKENTEVLTISHRCVTCNWQGSCRRRGFLCLGPLAFSPGPLIRTLHDASLLLHLVQVKSADVVGPQRQGRKVGMFPFIFWNVVVGD